ncbi:amidohydrolase family protein [Paraburkholderia youngii]|uniref:amidohydrolase family protein n=1 Tax=Paraburkholderia youngii TaxID=2782701 RepID=UPI003D2035E5
MINLGKLKALELPAAPVVERVVRSFGADRVMWGSDIAQSKGEYKDMVQLAKDSASSLSEADQRKVLHTTAERVYFS